MYVVVAGCGNLGRRLAESLSRDGNEVVVLDSRHEALDLLSPEFGGFRMEGDAGDAAVLEQAKLGSADLAIAATDDDNVNLFFAQSARFLFEVPRALVRVHDPAREAVFRRLGAETVCPTTVAADLMARLVSKGAEEEEGA
jgi:trk system potassium uptake protein TrkA